MLLFFSWVSSLFYPESGYRETRKNANEKTRGTGKRRRKGAAVGVGAGTGKRAGTRTGKRARMGERKGKGAQEVRNSLNYIVIALKEKVQCHLQTV